MTKIYKPYEEDEFYKRLLVGLSQITKEDYKQQFATWQEFIKTSPTEQIQKRMHDLTTTSIYLEA